VVRQGNGIDKDNQPASLCEEAQEASGFYQKASILPFCATYAHGTSMPSHSLSPLANNVIVNFVLLNFSKK
jgi:hypothetical protein